MDFRRRIRGGSSRSCATLGASAEASQREGTAGPGSSLPRAGIRSMRFLLFTKPVFFGDGKFPHLLWRRLSRHHRWTFACALAAVMTLLPCVAGAYQAEPYFGQANSVLFP